MPEETKVSAEKSGDNPQDGVAGAVETKEVSEVSFEDPTPAAGTKPTEDKGTEVGEGSTATDSPKQTAAQNAEYARRRREAERKRELKEARESAIIETLGGKNPYTGEEMKDGADVEEYLAMKEIEKAGGDPLGDFAKFHKEKERERVKSERDERERTEWYKNDAVDFKSKHPGVNLMELIEDKGFQDYADGKVGRKPLAEIYDGYRSLVGEKKDAEARAKAHAEAVAAQMVANRKASPGSLGDPKATEDAPFTKEQVLAMSEEEVRKNYDKIREDMKRWPRN